MEQIKLAELHLSSTRVKIDELLLPLLSDPEQTESAMTKTDTGYVYEIRYKQPGKNWITDAVTIVGIYEKLGKFMSLDRMRETVEGLAVQVGRLAQAVSTVKMPTVELPKLKKISITSKSASKKQLKAKKK